MSTDRNDPRATGAQLGDIAEAAPAAAVGDTSHVPSKRPAAKLAGPYGHPFHPTVVTLPIGAFTASVIFDIAARLGYVDSGSAAFAAAWLIVIGCVGALLAMVLGVMDLSTIPDGTPANRTAVTHGTINAVVTVVFVLSAFVRFSQGLEDVPELAFWLSVAALLVLGVGGYLGGKLAYTYGVRVAREPRQDEAYRPKQT